MFHDTRRMIDVLAELPPLRMARPIEGFLLSKTIRAACADSNIGKCRLKDGFVYVVFDWDWTAWLDSKCLPGQNLQLSDCWNHCRMTLDPTLAKKLCDGASSK